MRFRIRNKIRILFICFTAMFLSSASAEINSQIEEFDLRYYQPIKYNLKDLVFEVRISNLSEILNKHKAYGDIRDVYYKVYWIFPGQFRIVVNGLPRGFQDLRNELKGILKSRLDFVIPQMLSPKVRSYALSSEKKTDGGVLVKGIDKTYTRAVSRIHLHFGKSGKLERYETFSPNGSNASQMIMNVKPWSHNKWVIDKVVVSNSQGVLETSMESEIDYKSVDGFGFPESVNILMTQEINMPESEKSKKKNKREVKAKIVFSKYEVNTGKAKRYIVKGIKR